MSLSVAEFRAAYKQYDCRDEDEIARYLQVAECYCPLSVWGKRQPFGIELLTAHFLEVGWQQSIVTAGMATALGQSGNAQLPTQFEDTLTQTTHGRQFKLMWGTIPVAPLIIF